MSEYHYHPEADCDDEESRVECDEFGRPMRCSMCKCYLDDCECDDNERDDNDFDGDAY